MIDNAHGDTLTLSTLTRMFARTCRFDMNPAQWFSYNQMVMSIDSQKYAHASGIVAALPIAVNDNVPRDQVWMVAADGTVLSKVVGLGIPNGFKD